MKEVLNGGLPGPFSQSREFVVGAGSGESSSRLVHHADGALVPTRCVLILVPLKCLQVL